MYYTTNGDDLKISDKVNDPDVHQKTRDHQLGGCSMQRGHSNHRGLEDGTASGS